MQGTVVLGTGEPSPIMKRSPSARLNKEAISGEKLFQSFDLSSVGRSRRNSIPSPLGVRTESRGSVPLLLGVPGHRPNSGNNTVGRSSFSHPKYRSLKSYLKGLSDTSNNGVSNDLSKLDDKLAKIKHQLDDMSIETRNFGARVSSLVHDISALSNTVPNTPPHAAAAYAKNRTLPVTIAAGGNMAECCKRTSSSNLKQQSTTLPLSLPLTRAHSQPHCTHSALLLPENWAQTNGQFDLAVNNDNNIVSGNVSDPEAENISQDSQEDYEVKIIHSSLLDNHHHMIVVSSPHSNDHSSDENLNIEHNNELTGAMTEEAEDVFVHFNPDP